MRRVTRAVLMDAAEGNAAEDEIITLQDVRTNEKN